MPAISRPLLIALIAAVVALVGFYATQGARNSSESGDAVAPVVPAEPAPESSPSADRAEQPTSIAKVDRDAGNSEAVKPAKPDRSPRSDRSDRPRADKADGHKASRAAREAAAAKAAARRRARVERLGMPIPVARALDARKTVVLFFRGSGSADERATARAVAGLRGDRGVVVFSDRIGRLGRYRAVVGELGISQAPAVVIVDRGRSARVVQGYVDPATLAQDVADSR
jgi:hypothetical protein